MKKTDLSKKIIINDPINLYDQDFFKWTQSQSKLLRNINIENLDIENLAEEIESLGRSDKRSLRSYLRVLLIHLLKLNFNPTAKGNSNSWDSSIRNSRTSIEDLIKDSPSFKNELNKMFDECYIDARELASAESMIGISNFPEKCPWKIEEILPFLSKKKK